MLRIAFDLLVLLLHRAVQSCLIYAGQDPGLLCTPYLQVVSQWLTSVTIGYAY